MHEHDGQDGKDAWQESEETVSHSSAPADRKRVAEISATLNWPNRREAAISGNKEPSSDWESPHRFLILTCDIRQGQISINSQTLFLRMPAEKLKFWTDESFPGQISNDLMTK